MHYYSKIKSIKYVCNLPTSFYRQAQEKFRRKRIRNIRSGGEKQENCWLEGRIEEEKKEALKLMQQWLSTKHNKFISYNFEQSWASNKLWLLIL